ncbi:MAG: hypothetical protein EP330_30515 [Deltaproteobacteria bacterium]|nr:MAG: hypothetical protein EP330_30515 [Deltaproteobacteria bacterium]
MSDDWLWDGSGKPDPEDERIAGALKGLAYEGELPALPEQAAPRSWWVPAGFAAVVLLAAAMLLALRPPPVVEEADPIVASATAWGVEAVSGAPACDTVPMVQDRVLDQGSWLSTDRDDAARVTVADLGFLELSPDSALRLVSSTPEEHRLELAKGRIDVQVKAPPRVLVIDTPGGELVDLGCAYTMQVAENGYGELAVTDGWVAIEHSAHTVLVPEGARARTRGPLGPGLPVFDDAHPELRERAMAAADEAASDEALVWLTVHSRARDTLTLVHLLERVGVPQRQQLYRRIVDLVGPVSVSEDEIVALDRPALGKLLDEASRTW